MKRIVLWFSSTATAVVLLFSFHTSTQGAAAGVRNSAAAGVVTSGGTTTVTGTSADTRYGPVQVRITVSGGQLVSATAIVYPTGGRDSEINSYAIPVLDKETVAAKSASIDSVSGATFTSQGYVQSLQSALDQAHL
ncbi:MAG: hypothetical protein JWM02_3266 [Frankiales bacterium]|nr:hypothetical protein [Frankiales bacterium]